MGVAVHLGVFAANRRIGDWGTERSQRVSERERQGGFSGQGEQHRGWTSEEEEESLGQACISHATWRGKLRLTLHLMKQRYF